MLYHHTVRQLFLPSSPPPAEHKVTVSDDTAELAHSTCNTLKIVPAGSTVSPTTRGRKKSSVSCRDEAREAVTINEPQWATVSAKALVLSSP